MLRGCSLDVVSSGERGRKLVCSVSNVGLLIFAKNARAKKLEKILLTNTCQDKFIQRRNSLAFDLLVQFRGGKVSQMHQDASIYFKNYMLLLNIIGSHEYE